MSELLITLLDEVRPKTIRLLEMTPEDWLLWSPPGTQNHITWHAGHALWLADVLCIKLITGSGELKRDWADTFGMDGRPPSQTTVWPSKSALLHKLNEQHARVKELIKSLSDADLHRVVSPRTGATLRRLIIHGLHDEANHQGEIYLLLKLRRAFSASGAASGSSPARS